jgi:two-component system repressor protein LuxO
MEPREQPHSYRALIVGGGEQGMHVPREPLVAAGCTVHEARTRGDALTEVERLRPALLFVPAVLSDAPTHDLIAQVLELSPSSRCIVVSHGDQITQAARAMRAGAADCLFVPFTQKGLVRVTEAALRSLPGPGLSAAPAQTCGASASPARAGAGAVDLDPSVAAETGLIGEDAAMRTAWRMIAAVARSDATVFIQGETGTGKTLCARAVHLSSPRAAGPFVAIDCASLGRKAVDRLFSDADTDHDEFTAQAKGGTLFLDDICEMGLPVQIRLLGHLQETARQKPTVAQPDLQGTRIVCATTRDPGEEIRAGRLRPDLYYRLRIAPLHLPPLRERGEDIALIAQAKLREFASAEGGGFAGFSAEAVALLRRHQWPGNVRELINVIRHIVLAHRGETVEAYMLPAEIRAPGPAIDAPPATLDGLLGRPLAEIERTVIEATIAAEGGSVPRAARILDVAPSTLYRKRESWAKNEGG